MIPKLISFFILISITSLGQNLVPNGSFESYSQCPNSTGQFSFTGNWEFVGASTDYYHSCSSPGNMSVPSNIYGYQSAHNGTGYIGMVAYAVGDFQEENIYREPAGTFLTQPLTIGIKYFLSFRASLTINNFESGGACNKIGAKLSTVPYSNSNPAPVNNYAQVFTNSIISDTLEWTIVSGSFIADSTYSFLSIGNFFDSLNTQYIDFNGLWYTETAYYYIDDVRLSTDSSFVSAGSLRENRNASSFLVYPNPTQGTLNIMMADNRVPFVFSVFNSIGQKVYEINLKEDQNLDLSFLENGLYSIVIKNSTYQYSNRLLIQR